MIAPRKLIQFCVAIALVLLAASGIFAFSVGYLTPVASNAPATPAASIAVRPDIIPALDDVEEGEDFDSMARRCAPNVHPKTMRALVTTESAHNPFAIGVVGGYLERQPKTREEALATINDLVKQQYNFSIGLAQINRYNLEKYGQDYETILDVCVNLRTGAAILKDCYDRARLEQTDGQQALRAAMSCYYSGNFTRGFQVEADGNSYVDRVTAAAASGGKTAIRIVPEIRTSSSSGKKPTRRRNTDASWAFFAEDTPTPQQKASGGAVVPVPSEAQADWANFSIQKGGIP